MNEAFAVNEAWLEEIIEAALLIEIVICRSAVNETLWIDARE